MRGKKWLVLLLSIAMVFAVTACSGKSASDSGDKIKISYWGPFSGPDGPKMKEIVTNFNESQDKYLVDFQIIPQSEYYKKVDLAFNNGKNLPDVMIIHGDQLITYASKGVLKDMKTLLGDKIKTSDYHPKAIKAATIEDTLYGLPLDIHPLMLFWNKDMFKEAGLDPNKPPETREEFINYAKKLTNADKNQYGYVMPTLWPQQFIFPTIVYQNGGNFIKNGKVNYTSDAVVSALKFEHDLIYKHKVSPTDVAQDGEVTLFLQGKNAMMLNGPWMLNQLKESGLNFGEAVVPQLGTETMAVFANSHNFAVPKKIKDEKKLKGITEFLNYVNNHGMSWAESGMAPAAKATYTSDEFQKLEYQPAVAESFDHARFSPKVEDWGQTATPLWEAVNKVLLGEAKPMEALKKAEQKANKIFNQ